ncbi:hypothetical protein [uncultured Imperialibacter sp.]|uniref:hypothetical protein n=1 Tax=uncultured Imperialibacter sp. TaxID=1672639 RepID=UPI0030DC62E9
MNFIKNGPLDKSFGRLYAHLFDWRQETDYADFIDFNEETVLPLLEQVRKLNDEIHLLIESKL